MKRSLSIYFWLQLSLGLMFLALGILGLSGKGDGNWGTSLSRFFGSSSTFLATVMYIVELVAGVLLVVGLFGVIPDKLTSLLMLIIFIYWIVSIVLNYVFNGLFKPNFFSWIATVTPQVVVLLSIWVVYRNQE